jgi:hypothetical protein
LLPELVETTSNPAFILMGSSYTIEATVEFVPMYLNGAFDLIVAIRYHYETSGNLGDGILSNIARGAIAVMEIDVDVFLGHNNSMSSWGR